tara:strand:- start:221 stop:544 length:324 start_codon:yes stop_codon:yes gene_type:complete
VRPITAKGFKSCTILVWQTNSGIGDCTQQGQHSAVQILMNHLWRELGSLQVKTTFIRQGTISPPTNLREKRRNVESDTMMDLPFLRFKTLGIKGMTKIYVRSELEKP